jgi:hypothetical protein
LLPVGSILRTAWSPLPCDVKHPVSIDATRICLFLMITVSTGKQKLPFLSVFLWVEHILTAKWKTGKDQQTSSKQTTSIQLPYSKQRTQSQGGNLDKRLITHQPLTFWTKLDTAHDRLWWPLTVKFECNKEKRRKGKFLWFRFEHTYCKGDSNTCGMRQSSPPPNRLTSTPTQSPTWFELLRGITGTAPC